MGGGGALHLGARHLEGGAPTPWGLQRPSAPRPWSLGPGPSALSTSALGPQHLGPQHLGPRPSAGVVAVT